MSNYNIPLLTIKSKAENRDPNVSLSPVNHLTSTKDRQSGMKSHKEHRVTSRFASKQCDIWANRSRSTRTFKSKATYMP